VFFYRSDRFVVPLRYNTILEHAHTSNEFGFEEKTNQKKGNSGRRGDISFGVMAPARCFLGIRAFFVFSVQFSRV